MKLDREILEKIHYVMWVDACEYLIENMTVEQLEERDWSELELRGLRDFVCEMYHELEELLIDQEISLEPDKDEEEVHFNGLDRVKYLRDYQAHLKELRTVLEPFKRIRAFHPE